MIALILPMILNFFGTAGLSSLTKILDHKKELLIEAQKAQNNAARVQLEREIAQLNAQIEFEKQRVILGLEDRKHRLFRIGAYGLVLVVTSYWMARFSVRLLGLDADYHVVVSQLDVSEDIVSTIVLVYCFGRASVGR